MIGEDELPDYIVQRLPELAEPLRRISGENTYHKMQTLVDYTLQCLQQNNNSGVRKCLAIASGLYHAGSRTVKSAVANVYIYSFSHLLQDKERRRNLEHVLPISLLTEYKRQMLACNI